MSDEREMLAREICNASREHERRNADRWGPCVVHQQAAREVLASSQFARLIAAAKAEALREAADRLLLRRLGSATANPWVEGWNHALEVCRDEIRAALTAEPDATEGEGA